MLGNNEEVDFRQAIIILTTNVGSKAINMPPHIPAPGPFQSPPKNQGEVIHGSATVMINGKPAAHWKTDKYMKGFFSLQIHAGKQGTVHFRNIKVKELK